MNEYIDKRMLLNNIADNCCTADDAEEYEFWDRAWRYIRSAPTSDAQPKWIPVTERLPDVFKHVLVNIPGMAPHPTVQEAIREGDRTWYSNGFRYVAEDISHWMPLPEPPKEEKE